MSKFIRFVYHSLKDFFVSNVEDSWDDSNLICDIEGGWYIDDDGDLTVDVVYHNDDDD